MRPPYNDRFSFGNVGMPKYDWLKITEMHMLAAAAFVMADMPVSWTFLNKNCC